MSNVRLKVEKIFNKLMPVFYCSFFFNLFNLTCLYVSLCTEWEIFQFSDTTKFFVFFCCLLAVPTFVESKPLATGYLYAALEVRPMVCGLPPWYDPLEDKNTHYWQQYRNPQCCFLWFTLTLFLSFQCLQTDKITWINSIKKDNSKNCKTIKQTKTWGW